MRGQGGGPSACPDFDLGPERPGAEHRFVEAGGLRFHVVQAGQGPLVLLLHGFPEFWYSWRKQLPALAERFRPAAADLPGYNLSDPPPGGYDLRNLVPKLAALIPALGAERAHVVGHDWGGVLAWLLAMWAPERVERLVVLNGPHPAAFRRELRRNPRQLLKSWYMFYFQLPRLPEWWLGRDGARALAELLPRTAVQRETFSDEALRAYRTAFSRPGRLHAAIEYYRGVARLGWRGLGPLLRPIDAPTLLLWGQQDVALTPELADGLERWVPDLQVIRVADSGHWLHQERPELVNRALLEFLGR